MQPSSRSGVAGVRSVVLRPVGLVIVIAGFAVALPAIMAAVTGNLAIPHNDAWAYSLIAERFARTGVVRLVGWNHPFSVGQEIALGPLGRSLVAQQLFVVALALAGLAATYALLRASLPPFRALFGTAVLGAFPGFGLLATSFMEDIPTYCAIVFTLLVGRVAIKRGSVAGVAIAVAIGVWGFTTREQAIAAVAAVLICTFITWTDRARRTRTIALAAVTVAGVAALEAWRRSLANGQPPVFTIGWRSEAKASVEALFTLGLLILPATVAGVRPSRWGRPARGLAVLTGLGGAVFLARFHTLLLGNYLDSNGPYAAVLPLGTHVVLPPAVWDLVQLGAWLGGTLLIGAAVDLIVVDGVRTLDLSLAIFGLLTILGTAFTSLGGEVTYDRFLLPLVPVALVVVLRVAHPSVIPRWRSIAAGSLLGALFATSLAITASGLAFDSARWNAAQTLVRRGVDPKAIDAGLEWVGYHSPVPAVNAHPGGQRAELPWYAQVLFPGAPECYVVASSPVALGRITRRLSYRTYLVFGRSLLLLYDTGRCG